MEVKMFDENITAVNVILSQKVCLRVAARKKGLAVADQSRKSVILGCSNSKTQTKNEVYKATNF